MSRTTVHVSCEQATIKGGCLVCEFKSLDLQLPALLVFMDHYLGSITALLALYSPCFFYDL